MRRVIAAGLVVGVLVIRAASQADPPFFADVLRLLLLVSVACALLGAWLIVRRMAMMSDAIGHAILLGIVVMFFFVQDPSSPLFIVGAALAGLATVVLTEALVRTRLVREDASIGMVFSFLFALALVIIGLFFREAHVDQHLVLAGGVEFTVLNRIVIGEWAAPGWLAPAGALLERVLPAKEVVREGGTLVARGLDLGPRGVWTMGVITLVNLGVVALLWKELKLSTFDEGLAATLGFTPTLLGYGLMSLVAATAVGSFEAVGSILVVALFITPPATAYLLTDDLLEMVGLGVVVGAFDTWLGYMLAQSGDLNFGGSVALASGVVFIVVLLAAPDQGLVSQWLRRRRQRDRFEVDLLLVHLHSHAESPNVLEETSLASLPRHLRWTAPRAQTVVHRAAGNGLVEVSGGVVELTSRGVARAEAAIAV